MSQLDVLNMLMKQCMVATNKLAEKRRLEKKREKMFLRFKRFPDLETQIEVFNDGKIHGEE